MKRFFENIRTKWTKVAGKVMAAFAGICLLALMSFAASKHHDRRCKQVIIDIKDQDALQFIDKEEVTTLLNSRFHRTFIGDPVSSLPLDEIETLLRANKYVASAECYADIEVDIHIALSQVQPVCRIITDSDSYYLASDTSHVPLSSKFSAYVPLFTTRSSDSEVVKFNPHLLDSTAYIFSRFLAKDSIMTAISGQISVDKNYECTIIPRLGNFQILTGTVNDLDDKFTRVKAFYANVLPQAGWDRYSEISVKYKGQIIANH